MNYPNLSSPAFHACFVARFQADIIDLDDPEHVRAQAHRCSACLVQKPDLDLRALAGELRSFLQTWDREIIAMLAVWTNLEWQDSPDMEEHLRRVIEEVASAIEGRLEAIARPTPPGQR
jgi:hypothetical protein